jgi:hypothetical protein
VGDTAQTAARRRGTFDLFLFSVDPVLIRRAVEAGVAGIVVDWERNGKIRRQAGADTEINVHTVDDLRRVRACTDATVICRINAVGPGTAGEVEAALAAGADELLVPMVRTAGEVEHVLTLARERCRVGILVETNDAISVAAELAGLPLSRAYVGLNDLAIERRSPTIFRPLVDGTIDGLHDAFDVPFGFGGLTAPERGAPIPCRLLIAEMVRVGCSFSFLRRSFHRDIAGGDLRAEVGRLLRAIDDARTSVCAAEDRQELELTVESLGVQPEALRLGA